jgi:hypothetical protein
VLAGVSSAPGVRVGIFVAIGVEPLPVDGVPRGLQAVSRSMMKGNNLDLKCMEAFSYQFNEYVGI